MSTAQSAVSSAFFGFDRLDRVLAGVQERLSAAATETAVDAGVVDAAGVQRYEDGTLGPLDLTPGLTSTQVAYNRSARNAYITRQRLDGEHMAGELQRRNALNPDSFQKEWEAYTSGILSKVGNDRTAAALSLDLKAVGNQSYARLAQQKLEYDRGEQKTTFVDRATQLRAKAESLAARTGRFDSEEHRSIQAEVDALYANLVQDGHWKPAEARQAQHAFGEGVALQAYRTQVLATFQEGKTAAGPGNFAAAAEKARELAMKLAEEFYTDPHKATALLMGMAEQDQRVKTVRLEERRQERAMRNEERADRTYEQNRATERAVLDYVRGRRNEAPPPLFGSRAGGADVPGDDPGADAIAAAVEWAESSGRQSTVSPKGARGVMQLMMDGATLEYARRHNLPTDEASLSKLQDDEATNRKIGRWFLDQQLDRFGDVIPALAAYNAGPTRVARILSEIGGFSAETEEAFIAKLPAETRQYIDKVMERLSSDELAGGPGAASPAGGGMFRDEADMVRKLGPAGAARLIEMDRSWRERSERNAELERARSIKEFETMLSVAKPVRGEDGREGLQLPNGKIFYDVKDLPGDELDKAILASHYHTRLKTVATDAARADEQDLTRRISERSVLVQQLAERVMAGQEPLEAMASTVAQIRESSRDLTLPPAHRARWAALEERASKALSEAGKQMTELSDINRRAGLGLPLDRDEQRKWDKAQGLELAAPSRTREEAGAQVGRMVTDLTYRGFQIGEDNAGYIAQVLRFGGVRGSAGGFDLEKAWAVMDHVDRAPKADQDKFAAAMVAVVPNWAETEAVARAARELWQSSGKDVQVGGNVQRLPQINYAQAVEKIRETIDRQERGEIAKPTPVGRGEAEQYLSSNINRIAPNILSSAGLWDKAMWYAGQNSFTRALTFQMEPHKIPLPSGMVDSYMAALKVASTMPQSMLPGEREKFAMKKVAEEGWAPTRYDGDPSKVTGWAGAPERFAKKPIEWHMTQLGYEFGNQALVTYAGSMLAMERGLDPKVAYDYVRLGLVKPSQVPGTSRVQFIIASPADGSDPRAPYGVEGGVLASLRKGILPQELRFTWLADKTGRLIEMDLADPLFRDFQRELAAGTAREADRYSLTIPMGRTITWDPPAGMTREQAMEEALRRPAGSGVMPGVTVREREARVDIPLGDLIRDMIADPTNAVGGVSARRAFRSLYEKQVGPSQPDVRGDAGSDTLGVTGAADPWELAAGLWMIQIARKEGREPDMADIQKNLPEWAAMLRGSSGYPKMFRAGLPGEPDEAIDHLLKSMGARK